ncbi:MAG TPA: hypothetical protein VHO02_08370 [Fibrobacteria bacterium]|jgi:type II secretory pathway component PulM|nr:hypothetical protein [Fibrobacteria bacterium]
MRHPSRFPRVFALFALAGAAGLSAFLAVACASTYLAPEQESCRLMREQIREKQDLDARVKALAKEASKYRKQGDTAAAASAETRLRGLTETQRYLKESLDRNSESCSPTLKESSPVLDPARRHSEKP